MKQALSLLRLATERFPVPPNRGAHSLTSNAEGLLVLTLLLGGTWRGFTLDPADMDREPSDILDEIARMLAGVPGGAR